MPPALSTAIANAWLDALCRSVTWTEPAEFWVKLHTGSPGASGTSNPAAETTRKQPTFGAADMGRIQTTANLTWTAVSNTETYQYVSFWDASTGGNFLGSNALEVSAAVTAGGDFVIPAGQIQLFVTPTQTTAA